MSKIEHKLANSIIFVHSMIDDAGLSANEFRVYCHIARRAGAGLAFPSGDSIAEVCRMNKKTVWTVLASLEERKMVTRRNRKGTSNAYVLTTPDEWSRVLDRVDPIEGVTQNRYHPVDPKEVPPPDPKEVPLRISTEGNPHEGNPERGEADASCPASIFRECWARLLDAGFGVRYRAWLPAWTTSAKKLERIYKEDDFKTLVLFVLKEMANDPWLQQDDKRHHFNVARTLRPDIFETYASRFERNEA